MIDPHSSRPRILLVTRNLPPLRGGMERLNLHLATALASKYELMVIGPEGCAEFLPSNIEIVEVPVRPLIGFLLRSFWAAWRRSARPLDLVLAGSGLTVPGVIFAARRSGAVSVAYLHGLDIVASHPVYRAIWLPTLRRLHHAIANSEHTASIAREKGVAQGRLSVINPGVQLPVANQASPDTFRERHNLGRRPVLLSVGRLTSRKGVFEFLRDSLPTIQKRYPDVVLVVIGDEAPHALSGSRAGGRAELEKLAVGLGLANNLLLLDPCSDDELAQAYSAADVHVFPVRNVPGDVEGFGMVAIEAAAHGLPTVAFAVGGVPDAVRPGRSGYLVAPEDYARFSERVCEILGNGPTHEMRDSAREMAKSFAWNEFGLRLYALLEQVRSEVRT